MPREFVEVRMLQREGSIQSGEVIVVHHETAAKMVAEKRAAHHSEKAPPAKRLRFPLKPEFVAAGYAAESYDKALAEFVADAVAKGNVVEVRDRTAEELAEDSPKPTQGALDALNSITEPEPTPVSPPADALAPASEAITPAPELSPPPAPVAAPEPAPVKTGFFGKKKKG